ncbi:MAG TPA: ATP-binding protein [Gemmatimonadaceae bacterium]|nr:ATP-binding protein [Gemmatimonadaceae bacterium]
MTRLAFRSRLFVILLLFAVVPALVLTVAWGVFANKTLPLVGGGAAWDRLAQSGKELVTSLQTARLSPGQQARVGAHTRELEESITQARRLRFLSERAQPAVLLGGVLALALLGFAALRVAGHLSRQLSRPLDELVGWTDKIARGQQLTATSSARGAPEFDALRRHMRAMDGELRDARARELEAERLRAFRESARRVAHELKNPLTPIRFALARIQREAPNELQESIDVVRVETERLETLARSFAQFGRLPEGPAAEIDVEEMVRYTTRATVPPDIGLDMDIAADLPRLTGHYDALQRAFTNVLLNAVEACSAKTDARIGVRVDRVRDNGHESVAIMVRDTGPGIPADRLGAIWDPYVTNKPGGTGLGLAIARQAVEAHGGSVSASSASGVGTEVRFSIPVGSKTPAAEGG